MDYLPKIGIFVHFGPAHLVPLVDWLVVVARGLYLARHLFTLLYLGAYHYHANINCTDAGAATGANDSDECVLIGDYDLTWKTVMQFLLL